MRARLRVHPAGWALLALLLVTGRGAEALLAMGALLWHECTHLLALRAMGLAAGTVELTPFGGVMAAEALEDAPRGQRAIAALAGAAGSLALYGALGWIARPGPTLAAFRWMNLCLGVFNLLSALPLDGGRALQAALENVPWARRALTGAGAAAGLCLTALGLYGAWKGVYNPSLLAAGPYLCYAARQSAVTQRARLIERGLKLRDRLARRGRLRVDAVACRADAQAHELLDALLSRPAERFHYLVLLDPDGAVTETLPEREALARVLGGVAPEGFRVVQSGAATQERR